MDDEQRMQDEEMKDKMKAAYASRAKFSEDKKMALPGQHWSEKTLQQMTVRDWRIFREDFQISTRGGKCPNPMRNWDESGLPDEIMQAIKEKNYKKPSPIQMQCIPLGLLNRDVVGIAQTGSGKTCAFVLPLLVYIAKLGRITEETAAEGPMSVILAPSRELANQIYEEALTFCNCQEYNTWNTSQESAAQESQHKCERNPN